MLPLAPPPTWLQLSWNVSCSWNSWCRDVSSSTWSFSQEKGAASEIIRPCSGDFSQLVKITSRGSESLKRASKDSKHSWNHPNVNISFTFSLSSIYFLIFSGDHGACAWNYRHVRHRWTIIYPPLSLSVSLAVFVKGFSHLDVMLVECYDPKADQWNILQTPILEGRSGPGCAVLDDNIVLVGGYSWSMVRSNSNKAALWSDLRHLLLGFPFNPLTSIAANIPLHSDQWLFWQICSIFYQPISLNIKYLKELQIKQAQFPSLSPGLARRC